MPAQRVIDDFLENGPEHLRSMLKSEDAKALREQVGGIAAPLLKLGFKDTIKARDDAAAALLQPTASKRELLALLGAIVAVETALERRRHDKFRRSPGTTELERSVIALADGTRSIPEIAALAKKPPPIIYSVIRRLRDKGVHLSIRGYKPRLAEITELAS